MKMLQLTTFNNGELLINMDKKALVATWDNYKKIETDSTELEFVGTYVEFEGNNSYPLVKERPAEIWRKIQELSCEEDHKEVMIPDFHVDEDEE